MVEQSYDPIVPMKVGNRRAPQERPRNPLEGRGKQAHASVERRHNRDSEPGFLCAQTSTEYLYSPRKDYTFLGEAGEERLKNPLRSCTAGSVRGEFSLSHGGLNRARNWKRWIRPKKTYSSTRLLYSESGLEFCL